MISIIEMLSNFVIYLIQNLGYWGIFLGMTIESACIPLPSEVIMPFAGFVVNQGKLTFMGIVITGTLGNLVGSLIAYYVGLKGGRPFLEKYGSYIFINKRKLDLVDDIFQKHGNLTVFVGRILPVIRTFISLPAGISEMNIKKFSIYTVLGSLPWTFVLAYIGVKLGQNWSLIKPYFHILDIVMGIAIVLFIIYWIYDYRKNSSS